MKFIPVKALLVLCASSLLACAPYEGGGKGSGAENNPSSYEDVQVYLGNLHAGIYRDGMSVDIKDIVQVDKGVSKQKVREHLGEPQKDSDGAWWFYDINLPLDSGDDYLVCQYRLTFDNDDNVEEIDWRRQQCGALYNKLASGYMVDDVEVEQLTLSADLLFSFDSAVISPAGSKGLTTVVEVIKQKLKLEKVEITGYTDRLGSLDYNLELSLRRAIAVKNYLVANGVPFKSIVTDGKGPSDPVVQCPGERVTQALKDCLQPNRRVQIFIHGEKAE